MREQKTERSWGDCREEECEGFSALGSTSGSDETSSDKTPKTYGWGWVVSGSLTIYVITAMMPSHPP